MKRLALCALLFSLVVAPPAAAQTSPRAYEAVRNALLAVWEELPLSIAAATLTEGPAAGYGSYTPRPDNVVQPGETLHVYAELIGYGLKRSADGSFTRRLAADLTLLDAAGDVRAIARDYFTTETTARQRVLETYLSFTATLAEFEPGTYTLRYEVRDLVAGETAQFELQVVLAAGEADGEAGAE